MNTKSVFAVCFLALVSLAPLAMASTVFDATPAPPGVYSGTGNPDTNWTLTDIGDLQLGLTTINRYVGAIDPGSGSDTYDVTAGSNGGDATWDYGFLINMEAFGGTATFAHETFTLTIKDLTNGALATTSINPELILDDSCATGLTTGPGPCTSSNSGAENYENLTFPIVGLAGFDPNALDEYQITLLAVGPTALTSGSVTEFVQVVAPEPGTIGMALGGLLFVGVAGTIKQRRRNSIINLA